MNFAIEHLEHLSRLQMYCRLAGQAPKEGTVIFPYGKKGEYIYRIRNTNTIFHADMVEKIVLDKYGAEIYLK